MKRIFRIIVPLCVLSAAGTAAFAQGGRDDAPEYYVKHLVFPEGATLQEKVELAARLVPSEQQLAWQQREMTAFLHFGMNTFTDKEWGDGTEDPSLFNPTDLDADQWVRTLSEAGFKMAMITAKHHDGFCLWPTKTTEHSVASSPWKDGKGDVVRELREACDRYGMKFGVYLSPWDRNASCYGTPEYNQFFIEQLTELLTDYGEVDEVWFDGANGEGPNGKKQWYNWDAYYNTIKRLQPNAVMAIMGDDVRWVGNEKGLGRETEWSATVITPGVYERSERNNRQLGVFAKAPDLGSRDMLEKAGELFWYPSEVDVSIRPGWFYHEKEDGQVKSLKHLVDIYFQSVGYNSTLLLNVPPDTRGRIHAADSVRLSELAAYLNDTFSNDMVIDGEGLWPGSDGDSREYALQSGSKINAVMLQENIARGQRVDGFTIHALVKGEWVKVAEGTTIGNKRLVRFPAVKATALRVTLNRTRLSAEIIRVGAFYAEVLKENADEADFNGVPHDKWTILDEQPLTVDLGALYTLGGVSYIPDEEAHEKAARTVAGVRKGSAPAPEDLGYAYHYGVEVSGDGSHWKTVVADGEFGNIMYNPTPQIVEFDVKAPARYVRFPALTEQGLPAKVDPEEFGVIRSSMADDETLVYPDPGAALTLSPGDPHPSLPGWKFYAAEEFLPENTHDGRPAGFIEHAMGGVSRSARIDNGLCSAVEDGVLRLSSLHTESPVDNRFGSQVDYITSAYRTPRRGEEGYWISFRQNMRIEVRARRTPTVGFNDALWFMGDNDRGWPACGEIDMLENPKKIPNDIAHFTLHSENRFANQMGGPGGVTATAQLDDMSQWNIYWVEIHPDAIVGGVNGMAYFFHRRGDKGNPDWPWDDPGGFYMIISTGLSDDPGRWPGAVQPEEWDPSDPPSMWVDWVRIYVNDGFKGDPAGKALY